jgi:hypothetical protein
MKQHQEKILSDTTVVNDYRKTKATMSLFPKLDRMIGDITGVARQLREVLISLNQLQTQVSDTRREVERLGNLLASKKP